MPQFNPKERVQDQTTTTGTADYVIAGVAPDSTWRTIAAAHANGDTMTLFVQMGANVEVVYGTWVSASNTFSRDSVKFSTNANAKVNWGAGAKTVIEVVGSADVTTALIAYLQASAMAFSATQTFSGSSSALAEVLTNAAEVCTVSATAATGTLNYDVSAQSVLFYTSNASANWTLNVRHSAGTALNTAMAIGQSITITHLVTQGASAFYNNALQIDGAAVTPKWQGGSAPSSGNASSIDVYTYTIIKTANATFTVLASQTQFK